MKNLWIVLAILVLWSGTAGAEDKRKEAERFFRSAERAYKAAQYEAAAQAFERAYELLPLPAIAFSMAQAYRLQYARDEDDQKLRRAVELYRIYLKAEPNGSRASDASAGLADLLPAFSRLTGTGSEAMRLRETRIMVSSPVDEALGSIDGGALKKLPFVESVREGNHRVRVEAEGYFPIDQEYPVVSGQFRAVEADLKPKPVVLDIRARSGSQIQVDGRTVGTAPLENLEVTAGPHVVSASSPGHEAWSQSIEPRRGQTLSLDAQQPRTTQRIVSYAVLGTAGALLLGSGAFALGAAAQNRDAKALETRRQEAGLSAAELAELEGTIARRDDRVRASLFLLGGGLGAAAVGSVLFFWDHPRAERPVEIAPRVGAGGAGVALLGRF